MKRKLISLVILSVLATSSTLAVNTIESHAAVKTQYVNQVVTKSMQKELAKAQEPKTQQVFNQTEVKSNIFSNFFKKLSDFFR